MKRNLSWACLAWGASVTSGCGDTHPGSLWANDGALRVDSSSTDRDAAVGGPATNESEFDVTADAQTPNTSSTSDETSRRPDAGSVRSSEHEGSALTSLAQEERSTIGAEEPSSVTSTRDASSDVTWNDSFTTAPPGSSRSLASEMSASSAEGTTPSHGATEGEGTRETLLTSTNGARCTELIHVVALSSWGSALERQSFVSGGTSLTLCPGEETPECKATLGGQLKANGDSAERGCLWPDHCIQEPPLVASGCSSFLPYDGITTMWPTLLYEHCCFAGQLGELLGDESACSPDTESMRCGSICNTGRCQDSECVNVTPKDCDDGYFCNGEEWCQDDGNVGCRSGVKDLSDADACTTDSCDEDTQATLHDPVAECTTSKCDAPTEVYVARARKKMYSWLSPRQRSRACHSSVPVPRAIAGWMPKVERTFST
jgi:hypothetical protein